MTISPHLTFQQQIEIARKIIMYHRAMARSATERKTSVRYHLEGAEAIEALVELAEKLEIVRL